ncbi:MAG: NADH-quinone oxidoreductase subunit H, partial [Anaerolineae bacterium]|nr:NADH-quinone oxidoreductase subunit H [Anaerolineae bacterium]
YQIPFVPANNPIHTFLGPFVIIGKTFAFVFLTIWLRGTLPRVRVDHLMAFAWKVLVPLCLLNIFVVGLLAPFIETWRTTLGGWGSIPIIISLLVANAAMLGLLYVFANRVMRRDQKLAEGVAPAR